MTEISQEMKNIVESYAEGLGAIGTSAALIPHADIPIIAAGWVKMIHDLCQQSDLEIDSKSAAKLALAVAKSGGAMALGVKFMSSVLGWVGSIPTAGGSIIVATTINVAANYFVTKNLGHRIAGILTRDHIRGTDVFITLAAGLGVAGVVADIAASEVGEVLAEHEKIQNAEEINVTSASTDPPDTETNIASGITPSKTGPTPI